MSHGIILPVDMVFSTEGTEWHGLATVVDKITKETVSPILFDILTGKIVVSVAGEMVEMGRHKALVADYRFRKEEFEGTDYEGGLVPLNIPRASYREISNLEVFTTMTKALRDLDVKVTSAGTLEAGKKFFLSAKLGNNDEFTVNGDKMLATVNFITSHDGTLAFEAYDSMTRIVCMNTLRASRSAAGEVGFKVYHSAGADLAMSNVGELLNALIAGRKEFKTSMKYLASIALSKKDAELITAGYFVSQTGKEELAPRSVNAVQEIVRLYANGAGNKGQSLYDLLNGATEYWTFGEGTGKEGKASKANKAAKLYKANYASAADHKDRFANFLMSEETIAEFKRLGKKAVMAIK